jgi:hypothetical protein
VDVVPVSLGREVTRVDPTSEGLRATFGDGATDVFDHVVLGTGYRVDVARYSFLSSRMLSELQCVHGYPVLNGGFETSIPGLHFLGAPSAWSFGPLMRFVAGTSFTATRLAKFVASAGVGGRRQSSGSRA